MHRQTLLAKALFMWIHYDHAPPPDVAWVLMRARLCQAFGWTLDYVDGLSPATLAELLGFLGGQG